MKKTITWLDKRWKAVAGFVGAFISSLATLYQTTGKVTRNELLLALAAAVVTALTVHQAPANAE